jgi:hypothetical protein
MPEQSIRTILEQIAYFLGMALSAAGITVGGQKVLDRRRVDSEETTQATVCQEHHTLMRELKDDIRDLRSDAKDRSDKLNAIAEDVSYVRGLLDGGGR